MALCEWVVTLAMDVRAAEGVHDVGSVVLGPSQAWWLRATAILFVVLLGACVGSFLNVVIYRLPRGMSLVYPGSFCPACRRPVRWFHNIPVIGWLMLRGRCYDCRAPISPRYPLLEALTAAMFAALAWAGPLSLEHPPGAPAVGGAGGTPVDAWIQWGYRLVFLCALLAMAGIHWDSPSNISARYPWQIVAAAALVAVVVPLAWGHVVGPSLPTQLAAAAAALLMATATRTGGVAGSLAPAWAYAFVAGDLLLAGLFLGIAPLGPLAFAALLLDLAARRVARRPGRSLPGTWTTSLYAVCLAWLVGCSDLTVRAAGAAWYEWSGALALAFLLAAVWMGGQPRKRG